MSEKPRITELLPNSIPRVRRNEVPRVFGQAAATPLFCANCGVNGGYVPADTGHAFYLCPPCAERLPPIPGTVGIPDEVFFQQVWEEQLETWGRAATETELLQALDDSSSTISKLGRDRAKGI